MECLSENGLDIKDVEAALPFFLLLVVIPMPERLDLEAVHALCAEVSGESGVECTSATVGPGTDSKYFIMTNVEDTDSFCAAVKLL